MILDHCGVCDMASDWHGAPRCPTCFPPAEPDYLPPHDPPPSLKWCPKCVGDTSREPDGSCQFCGSKAIRRRGRDGGRRKDNDSRYRRLRKLFIDGCGSRCASCGIITRHPQLDHITPIVDGGDKYDQSNWQVLCKTCHTAKTRAESKARAARRRRVNRMSG